MGRDGVGFAVHPCETLRGPGWLLLRHDAREDSEGDLDDILAIEDKSVYLKDSKGGRAPGFECVDSRTARAHPAIIDALLADSERLWTMEDLLAETIG